MKTFTVSLTLFSLCLVAFLSANQEQEFITSEETAPSSKAATNSVVDEDAIRVSLAEDGTLAGKVFKTVDDRQQPVVAKVTISKLNGETLSSDYTDEAGEFKFEEIKPGFYTIVSVAPGFYADQTVDVTSYGESYTAQIPMEVAPGGFDAGAVYTGYQDAPIGNFSAGAPVVGGSCGIGSCGSCGGGGGCGGSGGGRLRALLPLVGLVGLVGLAGDDDDDDDASPAL